jgi:hypothetical protein
MPLRLPASESSSEPCSPGDRRATRRAGRLLNSQAGRSGRQTEPTGLADVAFASPPSARAFALQRRSSFGVCYRPSSSLTLSESSQELVLSRLTAAFLLDQPRRARRMSLLALRKQPRLARRVNMLALSGQQRRARRMKVLVALRKQPRLARRMKLLALSSQQRRVRRMKLLALRKQPRPVR